MPTGYHRVLSKCPSLQPAHMIQHNPAKLMSLNELFPPGALTAEMREPGDPAALLPVKVAADRQPLWPEGLVGSITHTSGFCAAVLARKQSLSAVGIDSEIAGSVKAELWRGICTPSEIAWLRSLPQGEQTAAAPLIFSAKEAFYKCPYPLVGERLNFSDATVEPAWGPARGVFTIHANRSIALARHGSLPLQGRYLFHEQFVTTGLAVQGAR